MQDIIRLLPDSIANQIAAGEVVQRPASVVKELLENAIDAGSTNIQLIIKEAGKALIQCIDNGAGMSATDARMSFERHATSKIKKAEDLFSIRTMGFRGEALASIAAVAQVELKTKRQTDELGTKIVIEGSEVKLQESVVQAQGSSVAVKNLFFNVPARRNFLKSNAVEMRHILDDFQRVALSNPEIEFSLYHNDIEVYHLPSGKLSHRIVSIFGKNYREQLVACKENTPLLSIDGYIGKPEFAKKTRGEQFFFVNNRYIRHSYLHHAVMTAFEGLIPSDAFPFYTLFIEIDPSHIDINVHPTKTEIKFDDERTVYAIIQAAIRRALGTHHVAPSIDFETNVNFNIQHMEPFLEKEKYNQEESSSNQTYGFQKSPLEKSNLKNWDKIYEGLEKDAVDLADWEKSQQKMLTFESGANKPSLPHEENITFKNEENIPFQLHQSYIVSQVKSGMLIIDQHAAHKRILYDKYVNMFNRKNNASQQLLFPAQITLNVTDVELLKEVKEEIHQLGFAFTWKNNQTLLLTGIPADISNENEKDLLENLIEQFKLHKATLNLSNQEKVAFSLAKRTALKHGKKLSPIEMNSLIDQLFASSNPNYAPDGDTIVVMMSLEKIASFFQN